MQPQYYEQKSGLDRMKNAFLLSFIGGILALIPVIGLIGGIIDFVAFIFWILTWRSFSRAQLPNSASYSWTWKILLIGFILSIAAVAVAFIFGFLGLIGSIIANSGAGTPPPNISTLPGFQSFIAIVLIGVLVAGAITFLANLKNYLSVRSLGFEVSTPRIVTAGNLNIIGLVISLTTSVVTVVVFIYGFASLTRVPTTQAFPGAGTYLLLLGTNLAFFAVIGIAAGIIAIVASYLGYRGAQDALFKSASAPPPPPPPTTTWGTTPPSGPAIGTTPPPAGGVTTFCPSCGSRLDRPNATFCTHCGARLSA